MITITEYDDYRFSPLDRTRWLLQRYTLPTVDAETESDEIKIPAPVGGIIMGIRIACDSRDYNLSVRSSSGLTPPDVEEVLTVEHIDREYKELGLHVPFWAEDEEFLYLKINNVHTAETGDIGLEIHFAS